MKQQLLFIILILFSSASFGEESKFLEEHEWPTSCKAAVTWLINNMDEKSRKRIRETSKSDLIQYHHGWGTGIRNNFGLWQGNSALMQSCLALREIASPFPDSISMIIIEETWAALNKIQE